MSGRMYWRQQAVPVFVQVLCLCAASLYLRALGPVSYTHLACPACEGLGKIHSIKKERVTDESLSLEDGAVRFFEKQYGKYQCSVDVYKRQHIVSSRLFSGCCPKRFSVNHITALIGFFVTVQPVSYTHLEQRGSVRRRDPGRKDRIHQRRGTLPCQSRSHRRQRVPSCDGSCKGRP